MFIEVIPHLGWPQSHADWSVTWEAIGAIGTTAAFFAAFVFGIFEVRKSRRLREEELLSHFKSLEFEFHMTAELNKPSTGEFTATNLSGYPFTRVSVLESVDGRPNWYSLPRKCKMGTVVGQEILKVERLRPFSLERLNFVYMDRFGQLWLLRYINFRPDFYNFEEVYRVEYRSAEEIEGSPGDYNIHFEPVVQKPSPLSRVIHRLKMLRNPENKPIQDKTTTM